MTGKTLAADDLREIQTEIAQFTALHESGIGTCAGVATNFKLILTVL